jgi:hypothetical protein
MDIEEYTLILHLNMILAFKAFFPASVKFDCVFLLKVSGKVSAESDGPLCNILPHLATEHLPQPTAFIPGCSH